MIGGSTLVQTKWWSTKKKLRHQRQHFFQLQRSKYFIINSYSKYVLISKVCAHIHIWQFLSFDEAEKDEQNGKEGNKKKNSNNTKTYQSFKFIKYLKSLLIWRFHAISFQRCDILSFIMTLNSSSVHNVVAMRVRMRTMYT